MNSEQIQQELEAITEEDILPGSIHLWHGVRQSLVAKGLLQTIQGENKMRKLNRKHPALGWVVGLSVTVILLGVFFFVTPQGKVLAQEIVSFFSRGESNQQIINQIEASLEPQPTELIATPLAVSPMLEEGCGSPLVPRCTLEEVQQDTPFSIQGFGTLPEGMAFSGAVTISHGVLLQYTGDYGSLMLIETLNDKDQMGTWTVGKDATIQSTTIHQYPAEFVEGSWSGLGGMKDDVLIWDESIPSRTLRWQAEAIDYTLINYPFRGVDGPIGYDMEQLKTLAEGLNIESDTSISTLPESGISLAEAEDKAGFIFKTTDKIPDGLTLFKTTYDTERNTICQYYRGYKDLPDLTTLVIAQSVWPMPSLEQFQSKAFFGDQQVEIGLAQEIMSIEGAVGNEAILYETGIQIDAFCGGLPSEIHRVISWQHQNRTFAVLARQDTTDGVSYVSKLEIQRIAKSLNGIDVEVDPSSLDPERLLSLKDAERSTGMKILQPSNMLSTFKFTHIYSGVAMGWPYRIVTEYKDNSDPLISGVVRILVVQIPHSDQTLEERRMAGGYSDTTVRGYPAIFMTFCYETELNGSHCNQEIVWFEGDTQYFIETNTKNQIPSETLIAIANSMQ